MPKQQLTDVQEMWLSSMEEDGLPQAKNRLHKPDEGYCCLGVSCLLYEAFHNKPARDGDSLGQIRGGFPSEKVMNWIGLHHSGAWRLARLNDVRGKSFKEIAVIVRRNPQEFFDA